MARWRSRHTSGGIGGGLGLVTLCVCGVLALAARDRGDRVTPTVTSVRKASTATSAPVGASTTATVLVAPKAKAPADTSVPAEAAVTTPQATAAANPPDDYTVVAGDTLSAIAKGMGVSVAALAGYNEIADPSRIWVGQLLEIPPADYSPPAPTATETPAPLPPTDTPAAETPTATPAPAAEPPTATPAPLVEAATATPQPTTTLVPTVYVAPPSANCDPSYPTVCIAPWPPDLDCGEIPYRRFKVVGSDPHGFDRDRDGVGCES